MQSFMNASICSRPLEATTKRTPQRILEHQQVNRHQGLALDEHLFYPSTNTFEVPLQPQENPPWNATVTDLESKFTPFCVHRASPNLCTSTQPHTHKTPCTTSALANDTLLSTYHNSHWSICITTPHHGCIITE